MRRNLDWSRREGHRKNLADERKRQLPVAFRPTSSIVYIDAFAPLGPKSPNSIHVYLNIRPASHQQASCARTLRFKFIITTMDTQTFSSLISYSWYSPAVPASWLWTCSGQNKVPRPRYRPPRWVCSLRHWWWHTLSWSLDLVQVVVR